MADSDDSVELLFFDTFSHEFNEDLNLDLVQFPQPVYIGEVRIIPLGARVQADFPGGVRLGATNPSKFHIELFVNDLSKPGASAFERLGDFQYNQNDCINYDAKSSNSSSNGGDRTRQIPTDGLVLRGSYTTITLAVYGSLAKDEISEQPISSPPPPVVPIEEISNSLANDEKSEAAHINSAIDFSTNATTDTKDIAQKYFTNESMNAEPIIATNVSISESARQYTEDWVASTGLPSSVDAKSPDIDNWDADDDLNKTTTTISSPRSGRRSPDARRLKRDWSTESPEYRRHRPYERGVLDKKLLKTREYEASRRSPPSAVRAAPRTPSPPEHIQSPSESTRRPRTPESHLSDDYHKYAKSVQSPQSVTEEVDNNEKATTAVSSIAPTEPDDDAMSQGEQFEPILSDDEIPDDVIDQYDMEYDEGENSIYSALKQFNPFTEEVKNYVPADEKMSANARELVELAAKCLHRSKLKESASIERTFVDSQSNEMRENWVHAAEQLIQIINLVYNLAGATQSRSQHTLNSLVKSNRQQLVDWMRIGLNFDCANSQQQPGYKIRHMKCGLRLIEMLAVDETFIESLIFKEKFNVFEYLYRLYEQKFMALSLKLMICRAIFACLDTKTGIDFFTRLDDNDGIKPVSAENGYQKLIKLLQENPLTRLKFPLKSILKKVNLYESLHVIRDIVNRRFVLNNDIKIEPGVSELAPNDEQLLSNCLREVWSAFTWDSQSYSQPKRFLPISTKFEKVRDVNANKMAANSFIRYFRINGLIESLLMIVSQSTNHDIVSEEVFDLTLLILESLCRTECGLNYLSEKSEVTNVLIKCLIQAPIENLNQSNQVDDVEMSNDIEAGANQTSLGDVSADIDDDSRRYLLGIEIAYKIKTKFYLDAIVDLPPNCDNREEQMTEYFHALYSLAVADNYVGRSHVIETITMNGNIITILKQIEYEKKKINSALQLAQNAPADAASNNATENATTSKKSPILCYAIDLIDLTVRFATTNLDYLRQHGTVLVNLAKSHDQFDDPDISQLLQETSIFLKPLQIQNVFSYDNIAPLCDVIKRSLEFITTFPGDLIMALRIIRYLSMPDVSTFNDGTDFVDTFGDAGATNKFRSSKDHQVELKYKFVILQFYSTADGISTCVQILEKLTTFFAQPAVHVATLGSMQGQMLTQILLPTVEILRKMLTYVIDCRNTEFKDLTAIEPLLKTYTLVSYIPSQSVAASDAISIQNEIIKTLMAYTQPTPADGDDTESVQKSLWTQMIGELCKYIMNGPHTILPGLSIFSQLLPVPLPVLTKHILTSAEQNRLITKRQLWSAHLHPQSNEISNLIQALCVSSYGPLIDLLSRVIGQLSDLAPNMSLLVTKAVVDTLLIDGSSSISTSTNTQNGSGATTPQTTNLSATVTSPTTGTAATAAINTSQTQTQQILAYVNPSTKRVLAFLSNILCYSPVKVAFLSTIHGKAFELLIKVLAVKSTAIPSNLLPILNQEQESVLMIFHTLLNSDISLVNQFEYGAGSKTSPSADSVVGCSIPPKDCYCSILASVLDWFFTVDDSLNTTSCQFAAMKTMTLATSYDFSTYQLKTLLDKRKDHLLTKLRALVQLVDDSDQIAQEILFSFLQFLLSLLVRSSDVVKIERSFTYSDAELVKLLQFKRTETNENQHPLLALEQSLQKLQAKTDQTEDVKLHLDEMAFTLKKLLSVLDAGIASIANSTKELMHVDSPAAEPPFPQSESIVTQYSMRSIFNIAAVSSEFKANDFPEQLSTQYWYSHLSSSRFEDLLDAQPPTTLDNVPCDFIEMIKSCLPPETNLTNDCKRLLHLSASPQSTRERTTSAPCFRTRRVEVEPTTGRPEKKLYISRGRGFPRTTQSRGDLFRSRPPNTSRPPSLHVDDFLALETCGAQPTGPTGYNKLSREIISIRGTRGGRGRGRLLSSSGAPYRHSSLRRTNSPSTWANHSIGNNDGSPSTASQHFRTATSEPVSSHFQSDYFSTRGRRGSLRPPRSFSKFN